MSTAPPLAARMAELAGRRVPFVKATVVRARRPASVRAGATALVLADGRIEGFVGGACAEATVRVQALRTLRSGESLLVRISPDERADGTGEPVIEEGAVRVANPCLSGGELEIFLEPLGPPARVLVVGGTPIARALLAFGPALGYEIAEPGAGGVTADDLAGVQAVVVASHGREDEEPALRAAVAARVPYVGLVASPRRGAAVLDALGLAAEERARVRTPAGVWIGARTPGEIAVSILAEVVGSVRIPGGGRTGPAITADPVSGADPVTAAEAGAAAGPVTATESDAAAYPVKAHGPSTATDPTTANDPPTATDPVCGMTVARTARTPYSDAGDGDRRWFCCRGCRVAYETDPARYPGTDAA